MLPPETKRILVYGVCGSGKTTFARDLSLATGIPWYSVDDIAWLPDWTPMPDDEQTERFSEICGQETWIMDTAYGKWLDVVLCRADVIIALDYPRWFSLARLLRRTIRRAITKEPCCNGNVESLIKAFSNDSIIGWHFKSFSRKRARIRTWQANPPVKQVIVFHRASEAATFLESFELAELGRD
ncbi:AAA family ATPase [soil metagenome]